MLHTHTHTVSVFSCYTSSLCFVESALSFTFTTRQALPAAMKRPSGVVHGSNDALADLPGGTMVSHMSHWGISEGHSLTLLLVPTTWETESGREVSLKTEN